MDNLSKMRRSSRRRGCRRNRRNIQRGGNGVAYTLGGPVAGSPIINNYGQEIVRFPSCEEASRPGYIPGSASITKGGLPGFAGGGRRRRSYKGGRYTFEPATINGVGMMEARYSGCGEGLSAVQNTLNKDAGFPGSVITAPPPQVPIPTPAGLKGGRRNRKSYRKYRQSGGVYGQGNQYAVDAMVYEAPRSGYTHLPSNSSGGDSGILADGKTPFMLNVPYVTQPAPSSACLKTGGGKRTRKGSRKQRRRKSTRRHR